MKKFSLLIIDDSEPDRYILKRKLSKVAPESHIFEAENGEAALTFFTDYNGKKDEFSSLFPPLLIFLDINMPLVNGLEFLEKFSPIRDSHSSYKNCVFIMFTSSESEDDRKQALQYDFVKGFMVKGRETPEELKKKIDGVLNQLHS